MCAVKLRVYAVVVVVAWGLRRPEKNCGSPGMESYVAEEDFDLWLPSTGITDVYHLAWHRRPFLRVFHTMAFGWQEEGSTNGLLTCRHGSLGVNTVGQINLCVDS